MNKNSLFLLLCLLPLRTAAQDALPERLPSAPESRQVKEAPAPGGLRQGQELPCGQSMPRSFRNTQPNGILREELLCPFFDKLSRNSEPVRIVHIGDSHVRGHVFPVAARRALEQAFGHEATYPDSITYRTSGKAHETGEPGLVYHAVGLNGATAAQFAAESRLDEIAALQPDLLILSFGTNESHGKRYDSTEHRQQLDSLLTLLRQRCPRALVMLTTPPGSYLRVNRRRKAVNPRTPLVVSTLLHYAEERELPVWDLYNIAGGKSRACLNWRERRYMQRDQVHYTHEGYRLQGRLLAEALIQSFNHYVAN